MKIILRLACIVAALAVLLLAVVGCVQRRLLYFPTHENTADSATHLGLAKWYVEGEYTGYARVVEHPRKIWLFIHGNGGQAGNRGYVLERIGSNDTIYILEYPGYGERPGQPSRSSFDAAALTAYQALVRQYGRDQIAVLGESLGSGPTCRLAQAPEPPRQIVLVVPFDVLKDVAQEAYRYLPVGLIMLDRWNNIEALKGFAGRLDIFGGTRDEVIPVHHARRLAASHPGAIYHEFDGNHGWANGGLVDLSKL